MKLIKRIWFKFVQTVLDTALSAVIRLRKTALPPKPVVWHDPRPYRNWRLDLLVRELETLGRKRDALGLSGPWDEDIEDVEFKRCLVLDEILTKRGLRDDAPRILGCN